MSLLLLDQEGTACDKGIESVCLLLERIGSPVDDKFIATVYQRLEKMLEKDNIQVDVRARMETVCEFWREHLSNNRRVGA